MAWNKRTLVYVEPRVDPARVLQDVHRVERGRYVVNTSRETANYVARQVKYSVDDYHGVVKDARLVALLDKVGVLQLTVKRGASAAVKVGYFNEWYAWMRPGMSVNVAPQHVDTWQAYRDVSQTLRDTLVGLLQSDGDAHGLSEMVFEKEWWTWTALDGVPGQEEGLSRLLRTLGLVDGDVRRGDYDAAEIVLDETRLAVYLYSCRVDEATPVEISVDRLEGDNIDRHEFAVLTEMAPNDDQVTPDRFLQGVRGVSDSASDDSSAAPLLPTMFVHMPAEYLLPHGGFRTRVDQAAGAALHPQLEFALDYDPWSFLPHDEHITDTAACRLHAELALSQEYILDRYELQRLADSDHSCLAGLHSVSNGGMDLELPVHRVAEWGSTADVLVDPACVAAHNGSFVVPLHLRYPEPLLAETDEPPQLSHPHSPWSSLYWECPVDASAAGPIAASFYHEPGRFPLGVDTAPVARRRYYYEPFSSDSDFSVSMPRGDGRRAADVDAATAFLVAAGSLAIAAVAIFKR